MASTVIPGNGLSHKGTHNAGTNTIGSIDPPSAKAKLAHAYDDASRQYTYTKAPHHIEDTKTTE